MISQASLLRDGYEIVDHVLEQAECDALSRVLVVPDRIAGVRRLMSIPAVARLATDPRLVRIARRVLVARGARGEPAPFRATLFAKSVRANWLVAWHQDTTLPFTARFPDPAFRGWSRKAGVDHAQAPAELLERIVALRVHIDASHPENGPLRVVPGSHLRGVLSGASVTEVARFRAAIDCPVPRGGVLAMSPLIVHASSKAASLEPRRVLHIEYAASLLVWPELRLAIV